MQTKRTEVKVFKVEALCDCGGVLVNQGRKFGSEFVHRCDTGGGFTRLDKQYPIIEYEEVEDNG